MGPEWGWCGRRNRYLVSTEWNEVGGVGELPGSEKVDPRGNLGKVKLFATSLLLPDVAPNDGGGLQLECGA